MHQGISGNSIGMIVAATVVAISMMAWPARARVLPDYIIDQLQARTAAFIHADGYTEVDPQTLPGDDWYTPARFPALGAGYSSVFRPDRDLDAVTRMVLLVQSREKPLAHVRYRVTYRLARPDDYPNVHRAFIQITRFNLGPTHYKYLLATANGRYPVAPREIFGIGPHVSWRFVTRQRQGMRAAVVSASRKEIDAATAQAANCLGQPCLALTDSRGPAGDWRQPTLPQFEAAVYGDPKANMPGPARVAEYLFAYATGKGFEPAAPAFADQPQLIFVISKDVEGQDATINGLLYEQNLMDDAISDIWTRRLQAGPHAIEWQRLVMSGRSAPQLPPKERPQTQSLAQSLEQTQQQAKAPPRFADYPAPPVYSGPPGQLRLAVTGALRNRITRQMRQPAAFAGEYIVMQQPCLSGDLCKMEFLVSRRTGRAVPMFFRASVPENSDTHRRVGEWVATARLDSRLLVTRKVVSADDGKSARYFNHYYVLRDGDLRLIDSIELHSPWSGNAGR